MLSLYTKPQIIQTLPVYTMPNHKAVSSDIGNQFRARPLLQWRKQYPATIISSRMSIGMPMDRPGSSAPATTNHCPACRGAATLRTDIFQDSPCKSCQPIRTKTQFKENTYTDTPEYLQSRCLTNAQQFSTSRDPAVIYFTPEGRPTNPADSPTGSQIRATRNCNNSLVKYIDTQLEKYIEPLVKCNTTVIYKPNNTQYAQQGGVSASSRLSRLKYNTLNNNGAAFNSAAGAVNINSGRYQTTASPDYYVKYKPQPNVCLRKSGAKNLCITGYSKYVEPIKPFKCSILEVNGGIFASQAELETIRGCSKVNGNIEIASNFDGQPDFTVFDCLQEITGSFSIFNNPSLTNISGFSRLTTIGGFFSIQSNQSLTNIPEFPQLKTIGRGFGIINNQELKTISGFSQLETIGEFFLIDSNQSLTTIPEFSQLATIGGFFEIDNNQELTNIPEFPKLTTIGTYIAVGNNQKLTNIYGFSQLTTIGTSIGIANNEKLTNISGFSQLTTIGTNIIIINNALLTNIPEFPQLKTIGGYFVIVNNPELQNISGFSQLETIGDFLSIDANNSLTSIPEFSLLTTIGTTLNISNNQNLTSISGFSQLTEISIYATTPVCFTINYNSSLITISGFTNLTIIRGAFSIMNNISLITISGFTLFRIINGGFFSIGFNQKLTTIPEFSRLRFISNYFSISNNMALLSIPEFSALATLGGYFSISNNSSLTSISGFPILPRIGSYLQIDNNGSLAIAGPTPNYIAITVSGFTSLTRINQNSFIFGSDEFHQTQITTATDTKITNAIVSGKTYTKNIFTKVFG